jgi:hypothetical protein
VWLASVSRWDGPERPLPTSAWAIQPHEATWRAGERVLDALLAGRGDATRERQFRMPITLCRHRALSDAEIAGLPAWWHEAEAIDLAGPPLEVQWSRGIRESLSVQPCRAPSRRKLPVKGGPTLAAGGLYLIEACGKCDTCKARARL